MKNTALLVDDDPFVLQVTAHLLDSFGFNNILKASCPAEALALWHDHKNEIGMLLTDINMPGMSGDELAAELLHADPDLEAVFMSGNPPELLHAKIPLASGVNFVQKPFTPQELAQVLHRPYSSTTAHKKPRFYAVNS